MSDDEIGTIFENGDTSIDEFLQQNKIVDESLSEFMYNIDNPNKFTLENYEQALIKNGQTISGWKKITKSATVVGKQFIAGLASTGINMVAGMAIDWVVTSISDYVNRYEIAAEDISNATSEFEESAREADALDKEVEKCHNRIAELQKLSDNGTISIVEQEELDKLKETNDELERKARYENDKKMQEANDALEKAKDGNNETFRSAAVVEIDDVSARGIRSTEKKTAVEALQEASDILSSITPEQEEEIKEFEKTHGPIHDDNGNLRFYGDQLPEGIRVPAESMTYAKENLESSLPIVENMINLYEKLKEYGVDLSQLSPEDKKLYENAVNAQESYLKYRWTEDPNAGTWKNLSSKTQRNIVKDKLKDQGLSSDELEAIANGISDEDLEKAYKLKFDFKPPNRKDYKNVKEYSKAYAEAWFNSSNQTLTNSFGQDESSDPLAKFSRKSWNAISSLEDGENGENKSIKQAQTSLQSLAEQGKLTVEAFNKTPGHQSILTYFGLEADEAVRKINGLIENSKQLDAMHAGITNITSHKYRNKTKAVS